MVVSTRLVIAALVATVGVVLAARSLWPARSSTSAAKPDSPLVVATPPLPVFSQAVNPVFDTAYSAESAGRTARQIAERAHAQADADSAIAGMGVRARETLTEAVADLAEVYLRGDYDRLSAFLARTGARVLDIEDASDDEARLKAARLVRRQWEAMSECIARNPLSPEGVRVRLRYLDGRPFPDADDAYLSAATVSPERWPGLAGEPVANKLTIIEVRWPVFYFRTRPDGPPTQGPTYFGIWFVWDPQRNDWRIHQTRMYDPMRLKISSCPLF